MTRAALHEEARVETYTLLYFTSSWTNGTDNMTLPRLRAVLGEVNALYRKHRLIELLQVVRTEDRGRVSDANVHWLDGSTFRLRCRMYKVTELPACVMLDAQGQVLTEENMRALELHEDGSVSTSRIETESLWEVLKELLKHHEASAAAWSSLRPLWQFSGFVLCHAPPPLLEADDATLVEMREKALELFESGEFLPAATGFVNALVRCPTCTKSSFNLAVILQTIGETYFAVRSMLRVVALDDSDFVAHAVLRSVYYLEEPDLVVSGYRQILSAHSKSHVRTAHTLATMQGATTTSTAAPAYVAKVFDELADSFEDKLVARLEYRVPWQLVEALQKLSPAGFTLKDSTAKPTWVVADVGCGTGLCGRLLRPHVKHITGVDISPLMIEKTRARGSYDELYTVDIAPFLESCADGSLDLIISADVWIYVGALERVFESAARTLRAFTGWMAFSIELLYPDATDSIEDTATGFRLAPSGRFQHSHSYIASLASRFAFTISLQEDVSVRKESGEPIPGRIYLLQRVAT
uniref:Methyltransferase type 11 domain-containing protein n=1 Tax=Peronospora matthiolae TaxID=2874970 RepID=A0AAV1VAL3_9STRA